jgi:tRNA pseudouridine-54 N-methylase
MREFILLSRKGTTDPNFDLSDLGRAGLDTVVRCISAAFCVSGHVRNDVTFHVFLGGPPSPPIHLRIDGPKLRSLDPSERGIGLFISKALRGRPSIQGVSATRESLEAFVRESCKGRKMYVLEEDGKDIDEVDLLDAIFILGDKVGLPRKEELFLERFGATKLSLGSNRYFSSQCVVILNYVLDRRLQGSRS